MYHVKQLKIYTMLELKIKAKEISKAIVTEMGDSGSCVMGCEIKVDGEELLFMREEDIVAVID